MAGSRRPSFLKRQKEQTRLARAAEKREARRARKLAKTTPASDDVLNEPPEAEAEEPGEVSDEPTP